MMTMELTDLDFNAGRVTIDINDGDDWTAFVATFSAKIFYQDTSFDHAFGTHTQGEWQVEIDDDIGLSLIDYEGKILPCDKVAVGQMIYEAFCDDHERYIPKPYKDDSYYVEEW